MRLLRRHPRRPAGPLRARRGRVALGAADGARRRAAAADGRDASRRPTGMRRSSSRARALRAIDYELPVAVGAGEVGRPARRRAGGRARRPSSSRSRRAITRSACSSARERGSRVARRASRSRALSELALAGGRDPRRHLVGSAVPRGGGDRARLRRSRCTASASTRGEPGSSTCSSAWARGSRSTTGGSIGGEPAGDVEVRASELVGATVSADEVPTLVDELPLLAVAAVPRARRDRRSRSGRAARARSPTGSRRSSRSSAGSAAHIRATDDGFRIRGVPTRLRGGVVDTRGDHRLAMLGAVAGVASREGVELRGADAVDTSFPGFFEVLEQVAPGAVHYPPAT